MPHKDGAVLSFEFKKEERISKKKDISSVFETGRRWSVKGMRMHVRANGLELNRAVFITVKKYGNSVERNRARRLASECWRLGKNDVRRAHDFAFVLYPGTDSLDERCSQIQKLLRHSGLQAGAKPEPVI